MCFDTCAREVEEKLQKVEQENRNNNLDSNWKEVHFQKAAEESDSLRYSTGGGGGGGGHDSWGKIEKWCKSMLRRVAHGFVASFTDVHDGAFVDPPYCCDSSLCGKSECMFVFA